MAGIWTEERRQKFQATMAAKREKQFEEAVAEVSQTTKPPKAKKAQVASAPRRTASTLDDAILKLEADLDALKRAREILAK